MSTWSRPGEYDAGVQLLRSCEVPRNPARPTPFAFPLLVEMFREELSTEALDVRVARMVEALERDAGITSVC